MLNRAAVILKYRDPAVRWINEADPSDSDAEVTQGDVNLESTVYLISDEDADDPEAVDRWLRVNYLELFESELEGWYTDEELWPRERTYELFLEWFEVECHSVIVDTVGGDLFDDES